MATKKGTKKKVKEEMDMETVLRQAFTLEMNNLIDSADLKVPNGDKPDIIETVMDLIGDPIMLLIENTVENEMAEYLPEVDDGDDDEEGEGDEDDLNDAA